MTIEYAYLDLDGVAYTGATVAEKSNYRYIKKDGSEKTELFKDAKSAKIWYDSAVGFDEIVPEEWERVTEVQLLPVEEAIKATEAELQKWKKSVIELTGNPDIIMKGYLTSSGRKSKDVDHLEDRYQYTRYVDKVNWEPKPKPTHLSACRNHLITTHSYIKMSPLGIEADAIVITLAERKGKLAVIGLKDKDLKQAMGTYYIDMYKPPEERTLELTTELGEVKLRVMARGRKDSEGHGFKFICLQAAIGDGADDYKGLKGFSHVGGVALLEDLKSVDECCAAMVELYESKVPEGKTYTDWTGATQVKTCHELLIQHFQLAYHERGGKDKSNPIERYLNGEDPIYRYGL